MFGLSLSAPNHINRILAAAKWKRRYSVLIDFAKMGLIVVADGYQETDLFRGCALMKGRGCCARSARFAFFDERHFG
jgi:hypothetical protein